MWTNDPLYSSIRIPTINPERLFFFSILLIKTCQKEEENETHIQLIGVVLPHHLALVPKLIEEEEPPKAIVADEAGETEKGKHSDAAERHLNDGIVRAPVLGVTGGTGEQEMRHDRDGDGEEDEDGPREKPRGEGGLVDAHPSEPRSEALQLVLRVRDAPLEFAFPQQAFSLLVHFVGKICPFFFPLFFLRDGSKINGFVISASNAGAGNL